MTPELSNLVANADAAKQKLAIAIHANETAAALAAQAKARHEECYAAVLAAQAELAATRDAIDAALDTDYGKRPEKQVVVHIPDVPAEPPATPAEVIVETEPVVATDIALEALTE